MEHKRPPLKRLRVKWWVFEPFGTLRVQYVAALRSAACNGDVIMMTSYHRSLPALCEELEYSTAS
eukprot:2742932-Amphidinium_carterae.1